MGNEGGGSISSRKDYKNTPAGQYEFWQKEFASCHTRVKKWHKQADKIVDKYVDSRSGEETQQEGFALNLFHSNVATLDSLLYGNLPQVDVSRKYADANDDTARVAAATMERLLNVDISANSDEYDAVLRGALQDRLLAGLGVGRVRYEADIEGEGEAAVLKSESAPIDYYFWRDVYWGWARNFNEVPWVAFRTFLTKDEVEKRFGKPAANGVKLKQEQTAGAESEQKETESNSSWQKAEVWEIWDKKKKEVIWISLGYPRVLQTKADPLKLKKFFPCPPFFIANATTTLYQPVPDFHLSQDLYNEIDVLQTRIAIITEAVKVIGVYDKSAEGVQRMFKEGVNNELIPVDNWAMFAEKGGIQGTIQWFPIQDVVNALDKLISLRDQTIALLQQVTGMSDIMQGGLQNQYEGVGQSEMKAKFGSIRIQKMQDEFATFASGLMQLKAEVICRHFDAKTIATQSNMVNSMDKDILPEAIKLLKSPTMASLRVVIRPESVAMTDFAQLQSERTGYMNALSTFMQSAAPLIESDPSAKPFLLQLLQWGLAGFKGSSEIEGVIDKAIEASIEEAKNPKPDPAEQQQEQAMALENARSQAKLQEVQAKSQADLTLRQADMQADIQTANAEHQGKMAEISANHQAAMAEIQAKAQMNIQSELQTSQVNAEQESMKQEGEMAKNQHATNLKLEEQTAASLLKIAEIERAAQAKITGDFVKAEVDIAVAEEKAPTGDDSA